VTAAIRVLLVEDDAGLRAELRLLLEDAGYVIVGEACDGAEGVACARREQPQVVISDLKMPGLNRLALAAELNGEIPGHHPVRLRRRGPAGSGPRRRRSLPDQGLSVSLHLRRSGAGC